MADLKYNKELYYKDLSHYFAFAAVDLFGGSVCIMFDMHNNKIVHCFAEIMPGYYLDARGVFTDFSERDEFVFSTILFYSKKDAQVILKSFKVKYTDVNHKKCVREYLRNNMLTFDYSQNGYTYTMGVCAITNVAGNPCVLTYSYDIGRKQWGSYIHTIPIGVFLSNIEKVHGFIPNKGWYYKK
mgnify:CR=1 FL=1